MISVILPVRNAAPWIEEALRSVDSQTVRPDEILVADDASDDGTPEIAQSLRIPGLRVFRSESRLGISRQLNRLVDESSGRWLARMDGDDISLPTRLGTQLRFMEARGLSVCGTWSRRFGRSDTEHRYPVEHDEIAAALTFSSPFCHPTVVFDRERMGSPLRYDPEFDFSEDYALWVELRSANRFGNVPEELFRWRLHSSNAGSASTTAAIQRTLSERIRSRFLSDSGVHLLPVERAALESRFRGEALDGPGMTAFLGALTTLRDRLPSGLGVSPGAVDGVLVHQWDLACLVSSWTLGRSLPVWWTGRKALRAAPSAGKALRIAAKSAIGMVRRAGAGFRPRPPVHRPDGTR